MTTETSLGRVLRTGLSSLRDRAASRLAALRFNPSRNQRIGGVSFANFIVAAILGAQGHTVTAILCFALAFYGFCLLLTEAERR